MAWKFGTSSRKGRKARWSKGYVNGKSSGSFPGFIREGNDRAKTLGTPFIDNPEQVRKNRKLWVGRQRYGGVQDYNVIVLIPGKTYRALFFFSGNEYIIKEEMVAAKTQRYSITYRDRNTAMNAWQGGAVAWMPYEVLEIEQKIPL